MRKQVGAAHGKNWVEEIKKLEEEKDMPKGRILTLKNNYGIIDTDAFKVENEWIPFKIENYMLEEKDGKQYIKYTKEVEFTLSQNQGIRDRDIKEATNIKFVGNEWKYRERIIENNAIQNKSA